MHQHETYIKRCLQIAKNGLGYTQPNPMVGCVIVVNSHIISEGYTSPYGGNHAEVNAIQAVKNKEVLKKAALYVTLEPCSHYGKTPPCSDLIIESGIKKVYIGCVDDNPDVAGKGIKNLQKAGCEVTVGILEKSCKNHHKRFFTFYNKKRPYIILKWAQTSDGFIAPKTKNAKKPVWITNSISRQLTHKWRAEEQAILVGKNTVLQDNPSLTTRDWCGKSPTRVVLANPENLPQNLNVLNQNSKTLFLLNKTVTEICNELYQNHINSVIIEGGTKTLQQFIDANLWDEARIFTNQLQFKTGTKAPKFSGKKTAEKSILNDTLSIHFND